MISAILLAAGASRRFGAQKLLQSVDHRTVIKCSAEALVHPMIDEIVVVLDRPATDSQIALELHFVEPRFVVSPRGLDGGMATSLAAGVGAVNEASEAVLVALGDEPRLPIEAIDRVIERYRKGDASVVIPRFRGTRGHPVLFAREVFPELVSLDGDHGARAVADRVPARRAFVDIDLPKPVDVDTPEDLARVRGQGHHSSP